MALKRYDIKKLLANPKLRRWMIANSTRITMMREGLDVTMKQCLDSYDEVMREERTKLWLRSFTR